MVHRPLLTTMLVKPGRGKEEIGIETAAAVAVKKRISLHLWLCDHRVLVV